MAGSTYDAATLEIFAEPPIGCTSRFWSSSTRIAVTASVIAVAVSYPAAYAIAKAPASRQTMLLVLVMLPFWSNYLIRTYAWMVLLNREGVINHALQSIGLIDEPLNILYGEFAIIVGLVYNYSPFVVLAIYAALQRLDPSYAEASRDLGAGAAMTFWRITLPLTASGVAAGAVFVFVLSIGNFITPDLLGGGRIQMVGNLIYDQFLSARDWPFGSALSMILIAIDDGGPVRAGARRQPGTRRNRPPTMRRILDVHLGCVLLFLYAPIATLMVLSFNRAGLPTVWTGLSLRLVREAPRQPGHRRGGAQFRHRRLDLDRTRDRARHAFGPRRRAPAAVRSARRASVRTDDHSRYRAGDRIVVIFHAARADARAPLDHPRACGFQHRLRLRRGEGAAQELRLVAYRGFPGSRGRRLSPRSGG